MLEEINLSDYLGQQIKFRFVLKSDGGTNADGFYFDDFKIFYNENNPNQAPVAAFTPSATSTCLGNTISFNDFSTNTPTTWAWDFGDGTTSNQQNPTHVYSNAGNYTVTLTVTNASGSNSTNSSITVNSLPTLTLVSNDPDNLVCDNGGLVTLTATPATATISGNGITANQFDPTAVSVGPQVISAIYTDANGCQASAQLTLIVEQCAGLGANPMLGISLYPNPNKGEFVVKNLEIGQSYSITDINGQIVDSGVINQVELTLNISNFSSGVYIFKTLKNGSTYYGKVLFAK